MSSQYTVCSLFWEDRGHCYHLKNQGMLEELLNDGWEISRVDTMPQTNFPSGAFGATNVYVLEKQSDDTKKSSASEPLPHDMRSTCGTRHERNILPEKRMERTL